jgi:hypothetical protein
MLVVEMGVVVLSKNSNVSVVGTMHAPEIEVIALPLDVRVLRY